MTCRLLAGWWRGRDIEVRERCGFIADFERELDDSRRRPSRALAHFRAAKVAGWRGAASCRKARKLLMRRSNSSPARHPNWHCCRLKTHWRWRNSQTCPGTIEQQPNWRRRYTARPQTCSTARACTQRLKPLAEREALMTLPRATMRLQLHRSFTFDDAAAPCPYFAAARAFHIFICRQS